MPDKKCDHKPRGYVTEYEVREETGFNAQAEGGIVVRIVCYRCDGFVGNAKITFDQIMYDEDEDEDDV